jgi:hypothetical protein
MTTLGLSLRDRVDDAYGRFRDAFDRASLSGNTDSAAELSDAADVLMRALARVLIQVNGRERDPT